MNKLTFHIPIEASNFLKLLACLVILLHHYSQQGLNMHHVSGPVFEILRSVGGDLSVTLFFFLSGYGLMVSELRREFEPKRFFVKRFWRVLRPFWFVNLIAVIVYCLLGANNIATLTPLHSVGAVLGVVIFDYSMWFIYFLLALYILFAVGMLFRHPVLITGTAVCIFVIIAVIKEYPSYLWSSLFAFPFGMLAGMKPTSIIGFFRKYKVFLASITVYAAIWYLFVFRSAGGNGALWHLMNNILLTILLLFFIGRAPVKYISWYRLPAKWQPYYEVYLVHSKILFITIFCIGFFPPLWLFIPLTAIVALIFCNALSLPKVVSRAQKGDSDSK